VLDRLSQTLMALRPELTVLTSHIAQSAKAVGAASLPFSSRFIV
jgi:hypothetical protein